MTLICPASALPDPLDPRFWAPTADPEPRYICWRDTGIRALVDEDIYHELARYSWNAFVTRTAFKTYFRRTASDGRTTILLHREVMRLHGIKPAHPDMKIVDHRDGNEFDCRGENLRWATYSLNSLNRKVA